jgi:hypothetical protein
MTEKDEDFFRNVIMGPDGPLYWILICAILVCALIPVIAISNWVRAKNLEVQCEKWVGSKYVFDDPLCYRTIDGKLYYVDIDREKAINEFERRKNEK